MTTRMLIDGSHSEELRVVVTDGNRILDYDVETAGKTQTKGNLYIGEITRVEPSLQAAFIDYGSTKNGFLAFSEIHPGFFELPEKEKQELIDELREIAERRNRDKNEEEEDKPRKRPVRGRKKKEEVEADLAEGEKTATNEPEEGKDDYLADSKDEAEAIRLSKEEMDEDARALAIANALANEDGVPEAPAEEQKPKRRGRPSKKDKEAEKAAKDSKKKMERKAPIHRRYQIQDVIKAGQKILVQVVKEERGTKGAALTTYFSLPGRYTVLMPNTPYAGGISRKITNGDDRKQLREAVEELKLSGDSGLIVRTAGVGQGKENIKKDFKNLNSLWKKIQKAANDGVAPECVHEDGTLAIRALRDMYNEEIEEIHICGRRAYRSSKDFAKALMPDLAKMVKEYKDDTPIFTEYGVEKQLRQLHKTRVNLPSGGYLIINPTEALVAIDVNSGRATQERNLEETALKTNMEAADEVARQVRLRDLSGLIVVDFIDMEDRRNGRALERAMRKAVRKDRARIQVGGISEFGLIEISRQRLRPSVVESTLQRCSHCHGSGWVPSMASSALMILRSLEEENMRSSADKVILTTNTELAVYILNQKRDLIRELEAKHKFRILIHANDSYIAPDYKLEMIVMKADGSESVQTKEIELRENPNDEGEPAKPVKRSRAGKGRKRDDKTEKSDEKPAEKKATKSDDKKRPARSKKAEDRKVEEKEASKKQGRRPRRTKALVQPDVIEKNADGKAIVDDTPAPMPKKLGRRPRATKKLVKADAQDTSKESEATPAKKPAKKAAKAPKKAAAVASDQATEEKPSMAKTFQRWWSRSE